MDENLSAIVESPEAERLATGFGFTEGALWHPDGHWLFVDLRASRIHRLIPGQEPEIVREDSGGANGLTLDLEGRLIICEGFARRVTRMEPDGSITTLADRWEGKRLHRPNDVVCRSDGSIYFTNPGGRLDPEEREIELSGPIHRIAPDGELSVVVADMEYPNGLAFSPDERTLYAANTRERTYIAAYDVAPDGSASNGRVFAEMPSGDEQGVPDGMKVDVEGRVYCTGPGGCWVFDASGNHIGTIRLPELPANCGWGGEDRRTMVFTARTSVYTLRMTTPGTPLSSAQ